MHAVLVQKERLGIHAAVHTTLQLALERGVTESQVPTLIDEIRVAVDQALSHIANELGLKALPSAPAPTPPVVAQAPVAPFVPVAKPAEVSTPAPAPKVPARRILIKRVRTRFVLPDEVLLNVFQRLLPPPPAPGGARHLFLHGRFTDLVTVSAVCEDWRAVAVRTPHLWTRLVGLSFGELCALPDLLARSMPLPVHVDLDMRSDRRYHNREIADALAFNMSRIRSLVVRVNPAHTAAWYTLQGPLQVEAPLLERFEFEFLSTGGSFALPSTDRLFGRRAPLLTHLALDPDLLPRGAEFPHVVTFDARSLGVILDFHTRAVFMACPRLKTLFLSTPLKDAREVLKPRASWPEGPDGHPGAFYAFRRNLDHLHVDGDTAADVVPTLQLFNHKHIKHVHLVSPPSATFDYVRRRILEVRNLSVGEARIALRDAQKYERVFSAMSPPILEELLRQTHDLFSQLESLTVWDRLPDASTYRALVARRLPCVHKLSILIRPPPYPSSYPSLFEVMRRERWDIPQLTTLTLTAHDVSGHFDAPHPCAAVRVRDLLDFVRDGVRHKALRLREIVLDDVVFVEGMGSPLVDELRRLVDDMYFS